MVNLKSVKKPPKLVLKMMFQVERVFNNVWGILKIPRKIYKRFGFYFLVLLLTPFIIIIFGTGIVYATIDDLQNFWGYRVKVTVDPVNMTFATTTTENNNLNGDDINVTITGGKIVVGGGKQKNGSVTDTIEFYVNFSDDGYPAAYGYAKYHVYGVRYSGLKEND